VYSIIFSLIAAQELVRAAQRNKVSLENAFIKLSLDPIGNGSPNPLPISEYFIDTSRHSILYNVDTVNKKVIVVRIIYSTTRIRLLRNNK
jgi:plasmid stabilization system protein ParE